MIHRVPVLPLQELVAEAGTHLPCVRGEVSDPNLASVTVNGVVVSRHTAVVGNWIFSRVVMPPKEIPPTRHPEQRPGNRARRSASIARPPAKINSADNPATGRPKNYRGASPQAARVGRPTQPSGITRHDTSSAVSIDGS